MNTTETIHDSKGKIFCKSGGCGAKLGAGLLSHILERLPAQKPKDKLMVGFDSHDDAAVYQIDDTTAFVQTLDFFPPMVEDAYTFGQIAAANAMSDIYAMGGEVKTALNIVCFPENMDINILGEIMRGGMDKVIEAGGCLCGGHSIADEGIKYGLSVTGLVNPSRILRNNTPQNGDVLVLTKPLGVGIITTAARFGAVNDGAYKSAVTSMTTLNKYAAEIAADFDVHACTDVTGFGLLGHLKEMLDGRFSAELYCSSIPMIEDALDCAREFYITGAGQKNRNYVGDSVAFEDLPFEWEEVLFDPQTSGGLLIAMDENEACEYVGLMKQKGYIASIIGRITKETNRKVVVKNNEKNN